MRPPLFLLLLLAGCSVAAPSGAAPAPEPQPDPYARCWSGPAPEGCEERVEQGLLDATDGRVERRGDTLRVRTSSGYPARFVDDAAEGDRYRSYRYLGEVEPLASHLLRVSFYEGGTYVLVSGATGGETHLISRPLFSPDGERFATASLDLEAGYEPNGLQVWRAGEHGPRLEWELMGGASWGASGLVWRTPRVLEFTKHAIVPPRVEPVRTRMRLTLTPGGLELRPIP